MTDCILDVLKFLKSDYIQGQAASGRLRFAPPATAPQRDKLLLEIPPAYRGSMKQLLQFTSGLDLGSEDNDIQVRFLSKIPTEFELTYPSAIDLEFCEVIGDTFAWDLTDGSGAVYAVFHDEPLHCLYARNLIDFLEGLNQTRSIEFPDHAFHSPSDWPTVADQKPATQDLAGFLARFEPQYWVHDFRGRDDCAFHYRTFNIWRFGSERFWVQERPKRLRHRFNWWWRTVTRKRLGGGNEDASSC